MNEYGFYQFIQQHEQDLVNRKDVTPEYREHVRLTALLWRFYASPSQQGNEWQRECLEHRKTIAELEGTLAEVATERDRLKWQLENLRQKHIEQAKAKMPESLHE